MKIALIRIQKNIVQNCRESLSYAISELDSHAVIQGSNPADGP